MNDLIKAENIETMTSTQIAELLGKEKKEINREIKNMFPDKIVGGDFSPTLRPNGQVLEYHLPELESKMFVAKQDINYLEKITRFWIDRNNKPALPDFTNPAAAARAYADQWERAALAEKANKQLLKQAIEDKPLVEFAKTVEGTDKKVSIGDMAKLSGRIGRNNLFKALRDNKVLIGQGRGKNKPYQRYIDLGYFEVSETIAKRTNGDIITFTSHVTGKGQTWLMGKIKEWTK